MEMFGLPLLSHALQIQFAPKKLNSGCSFNLLRLTFCSGNGVEAEQNDRTGYFS